MEVLASEWKSGRFLGGGFGGFGGSGRQFGIQESAKKHRFGGFGARGLKSGIILPESEFLKGNWGQKKQISSRNKRKQWEISGFCRRVCSTAAL